MLSVPLSNKKIIIKARVIGPDIAGPYMGP